ncbi:MAG: ABC transporter ATP-binding protein [Actinomycetaceae bacterium]|nr:ABC transporter ATP-binding protein [Actinomycetaceae bacterium]
MPPLVEVTDLHFRWDKEEVLRGLSMTMESGQLTCLLGPNGAGKTTLVENLLGSVRPDRGTVAVLGHNPTSAPPSFWPQIGLVQQSWSDHPKWRVHEHLEWIRTHLASVTSTRTVMEVLEAVGLPEKAKERISSLSGGQRRRMDFAAAILSQPKVLILDEPTTGLDPISKAQIHDLVSDCLDHGAAVLYTTHDLAEAHKISSRITIMKDGVFAISGTADEILAQHSQSVEITWVEDGRSFVHSTETPEAYLRTLLQRDIHHLSVTRPTLEDAYIAIMNKENS